MASLLPKDFIYKRLHSITGLFLVLYLIEHLLVNSQAALFIGNDGQGFINSVNSIHDLPYLKVLEISLIAIPLLIHMWWGVIYAYTGTFNSYSSDGATSSLPYYPRNHAYTLQSITS